MTVSQTLPSGVLSVAEPAMWSAFRMSRMILPDGDWMASLAGFSRLLLLDLPDITADVDAEKPSTDVVDALEPP